MDDTSAYSHEREWPAIRLRPLHRTTIISPTGGHATWTRGELTEQQDVTPAEFDSMKAHYLDYWTSAFYTRTPIHHLIVGTEHENPMHIHKHYCPAVPNPLLATERPGKKSTRYLWPIEFASPGRYRIQFYQVGERAFVVDQLPTEYPNAHKAHLTVAGATYDWSAEQGGLPTFEIEVKPGQYLLGAVINIGTKAHNPEWLVIEKLL